jgi:hypothetical protein
MKDVARASASCRRGKPMATKILVEELKHSSALQQEDVRLIITSPILK